MKDWIKNFKDSKGMRVLIFIYAFFFLLLVVVSGDMQLIGWSDTDYNITTLNDDWDIKINEKEYKDVSLDEFSFDTVTKNDVIEMKTTLPEEWDYIDTVMCFHTRQATVEMYVEDEIVYEYGQDRREEGKTVGSGLLYIDLFDEYKGKDIRISLVVSEKNAFSKIDEITISEWKDLYRYILVNNRIPLYLGSFFLVFGIICVLISGVGMLFAFRLIRLFWLAKFSVCFGIWTLCYYNCIIIFSIPLYWITLMEIIALLLTPVPIMGYMREYVKVLNSRKYIIMYNILFITQSVFTVTFIALHATDTLHVAEVLSYFHILVFIELIFFAKVLITSMRKNRKIQKSLTVVYLGPILVIGFILYDLIIYIVNRYSGFSLPKIQGFTPIGIFLFMAVLIIDMWHNVTERMIEKQENELLISRAYSDGLTLMNNRRFCTEYMTKITKEGLDFTIINFDLNGLKETNDIYGHTKGDLLLKNAAFAITNSFGKAGVVGRMGGDEFIGIIETVDKDEIDRLIAEFHGIINEINKNEPELNLVIAYGYAFSTEIENCDDSEKVFNIADERMYVNKKLMKLMSPM